MSKDKKKTSIRLYTFASSTIKITLVALCFWVSKNKFFSQYKYNTVSVAYIPTRIYLTIKYQFYIYFDINKQTLFSMARQFFRCSYNLHSKIFHSFHIQCITSYNRLQHTNAHLIEKYTKWTIHVLLPSHTKVKTIVCGWQFPFFHLFFCYFLFV